jgi:hypothetical protein
LKGIRNSGNEFLPRAHSAAYGDLDKANWKDLRIRRNWNFIDPAIRPVIKVLNEHGYKTFSCCSGGHKRNLHRPYVDHEAGYIGFYPASNIAYKLYSELRNRQKRFELDVRTRTISRTGTRGRIETTDFGWLLATGETSKRIYYFGLFEDLISIIEKKGKKRS